MRKTYEIIIADPPWTYNYASVQSKSNGGRGCANDQYSLIDNKVLRTMPVAKIAAPRGSALFLWSSFALLPDCLEVMRSWGFDYKTSVVWTKHCKDDYSRDRKGVGYWFRSNAELVLIGVRGANMARRTNRSNHFRTPAQGHSQKPDYLHELVEEFWPEANKAELFARRNRDGWDCWGDECPKSSERLVQAFGNPWIPASEPQEEGNF